MTKINEINKCQYRFCKSPVPTDRRSDARYCCNQHGWQERNERKKDDLIKVLGEKSLRNNYKIIKDLFSRGIKEVEKNVLDAMGFDFEIHSRVNRNADPIEVDIYSYRLMICDTKYQIIKIEI